MDRRWVVALGMVAVLGWVAVPEVLAQKVKDFVEIDGARSNYLVGEGLVVGLNGNGDSPKGLTAQRLRVFLTQHAGWQVRESDLNSKNVALVTVTAELPPFQAEGTRVDVRVNILNDAKSLSGGTLLITPLRSPLVRAEDPTVYALAQGQLIVEGDRSLSSAHIPGGAIMETPLVHNFIKTAEDGTRYVVLRLRKGDFSLANAIANQINQSDRIDLSLADGMSLNVAQAVDGGTIVVKIPASSNENFISNPVKFISRVLEVDVQLVDADKAIVLINDKTKVISTTGSARVRPGNVWVGKTMVNVPNEKTVQALLEDYNQKLTPQEMIEVIKSLDQLGLIKGIVISR